MSFYYFILTIWYMVTPTGSRFILWYLLVYNENTDVITQEYNLRKIMKEIINISIDKCRANYDRRN